MATRGLDLRRARRRKWLTGLLVAGISITAIVVGWTYWGSTHRPAPSQQEIPPSPPPNVNQQLSGYTFTRSDKGRAIFTVHAARTVTYQQSKSTELQGVTVQVYGRKGDRGDILRTERCEYDPDTGDFISSGPVGIELAANASDIPGSGLRGKHRVFLETSKVAYHQDDELAETDEPVKFRTGPISGSALGMIYATSDGWVTLKHNVAADLAQGTDKAPKSPIHLSASALHYDKDAGTVTLAGPVTVSQGGSKTVSERAAIALDGHNRITRVDFDGGVKAFETDPLRTAELDAKHVRGDFDAVSGELRHVTAETDVVGESKGRGSTSHLTAQRVEMDLAGKRPKPLRGVATGNVHIVSESQAVVNVPSKNSDGKAQEQKTLSAADVRFEFRPGGQSLKDAETVGPGTLLISPADPKSGEKVISAGQFLMNFDARSRIESLRGTAPTEVLFRPPASAPAGSPTRQSHAERLTATFEPGSQGLREVRQSGNFQYRDGDRQATADDAQYDPQTQTVLLLGHPQVWDPGSRAKCQKITIDMRTNTAVGDGKVQATHLPAPAPGARASSSPVLPTNVLADRMVARQQGQTVHYEGHVRAWHGTDVVESSALDVYRTQKRVSTGSGVVTTYVQPATMSREQGATKASAGETSPVTVRADSLDYFDQGRVARYHGHVCLVSESTTVQSDRLDVYFTQKGTVEGSEVDHAEADGHAKVTQPGRLGTSDRAEYFAATGKIVLSGGPPILVDEAKGSTTGQRLTFFIHDDRLFVDGGTQSPSLSKHRVVR